LDGRILKRHAEKSNAIGISRRHSHAHPPQKQKRGLPNERPDQRRTIGSVSPLDSIRRLIERLVRPQAHRRGVS
jgi:hypothetical protein